MKMRLLMGLVAGLSIAGMTKGTAQTIQKGKLISIAATGIPGAEKAIVDNTYPVSEDGFLNLPFVGKIPAAGLSPQELEKALETVFQEKGIYSGARFQVATPGCQLRDQETVIVGGQVKRPGSVPMTK